MLESFKKFIERGKKGYCYSDLWSWDYFFSKLIATSLKEFKSKCGGYPSSAVTYEGWLKILDEIIDCFEEQCRSTDNIPLKEVPGNKYLKEIDFEAMKEREARKAEKLHKGFELLEKYYYDLWD